eukprot:NODE_16_length_49026_cov_1.035992.p7 type:complete len:439 gc:universal NODE_16_length_49026_cov_1.035992:38788-37472(-)
MDIQYQVRHSSFRSSKYEYKYINPKVVVQVLGKSYKLSSETINVYNSLITDFLNYVITDASGIIISIEDIKSASVKAVSKPFSNDLINFTNRDFFEQTKDENFKESFELKSLHRNSLYKFLISQHGKVIETDTIRTESEKLLSTQGKRFKNDLVIEYLSCLLQVFASYIAMLIYKKCVESEATVIKTDDFFKLLSDDASIHDFVEKSETKRYQDRRESINFSSKRNTTIQISDLISKSEIPDSGDQLTDAEKRMAQVDLEKRKTLVQDKKINEEEETESEALSELNKKQPSETSTVVNSNSVVEKKKPVRKLEARVEAPRIKGEDQDFTESERDNLKSLLDFLDTDPETVLGPKKAVDPPKSPTKDKEGLVRKSFKVFNSIKTNSNPRKEKVKNLEDLKKDSEMFTSEDSFEDKFLKKDLNQSVKPQPRIIPVEAKEY